MSTLIQAGQLLVAGTGQAQLNEYYGLADTNQTTITAASFGNLSNVYTIPANEANYADVAYELTCSGQGTWGSTQQQLYLSMAMNGTQFGSGSYVAAAALSASATFTWRMTFRLTCSDGISSWWCDMDGIVQQNSNPVLPGTAADNAIPLVSSNSAAHTAAISSNITVAVQAKWAATTGAPTITCYKTQFRKVA